MREYRVWLNAGIYMRRGFDVSTFIAFSKLDAQRFNETECIKKYDSFDKYEPNSKPMSFYLKKKWIIMSADNTHILENQSKELISHSLKIITVMTIKFIFRKRMKLG